MRLEDIKAKAASRRELAFQLRSEGKTYREIGTALGCSGSRAKSLVDREERRKRYTPKWYDGLSTRATNGLICAGCKSKEDAAKLTDLQLLDIPNVGRLAVAEIRAWVDGVEPPSKQDIENESKKMKIAYARHRLEEAQKRLAELENM